VRRVPRDPGGALLHYLFFLPNASRRVYSTFTVSSVLCTNLRRLLARNVVAYCAAHDVRIVSDFDLLHILR
jgi:hypothetical protein